MTRTRTTAIVIVVIAVAVAAAFLLPKPSTNTSPDPSVASDFQQRRLEYQTSLNKSEQRFEPGFYIIVLNGRVYMRTDLKNEVTGYCRIRCGTITKGETSYYISLPVGYAHSNNVVPDPTSWEPVRYLTYWNPLTQAVETTMEPGDDGVTLPDVLKDNHTSADIQPGETMYTNANFIRQTSTGETWMIDGVLAYELLGREYGYAIDTSVTRRIIGGLLVVKLPKNTTPLFTESPPSEIHSVPVLVVS